MTDTVLSELVQMQNGIIGEKNMRIAELETALKRAKDDMQNWQDYAPDYFREKWDAQGDLDNITRVLEGKPL